MPTGKTRLVSFSDECIVPPLYSVQWMDIYIPSRPPYSLRHLNDTHERISLLSLHPTAPFRIDVPMLSAFSNKHLLTLASVSEAAREWDGSTPISLKFNKGFLILDFVITLGRCTRGQAVDFGDATSDSDKAVLGPHFITVQEDSESTPEDPSHSCEEDHVEAGTIRLWGLQSDVGWYKPCELQLSLTRSNFDSGSANMLEVHLEVV